jgi:hypothetical protein
VPAGHESLVSTDGDGGWYLNREMPSRLRERFTPKADPDVQPDYTKPCYAPAPWHGWVCTRARGHDGIHVAHVAARHTAWGEGFGVVAEWKQ